MHRAGGLGKASKVGGRPGSSYEARAWWPQVRGQAGLAHWADPGPVSAKLQYVQGSEEGVRCGCFRAAVTDRW